MAANQVETCAAPSAPAPAADTGVVPSPPPTAAAAAREVGRSTTPAQASGEAKRKSTRSGFCLAACGYCGLACGLLFLVAGIYSVYLFRKLSPVYQDITCQMEPPKLTSDAVQSVISGFTNLLPGSGSRTVQLQLSTTTTCYNPNVYSVELQSTAPGQVYVSSYTQPAMARITQIPPATLPAQGSGSVTALTSFSIDPSTFGGAGGAGIAGVISSVLGGGIPVYVESHMEVVVGLRILGGGFTVKQPFDKKCAFLMSPLAGFKTGPMTCAEDFQSLRPQPVDASSSNQIRFSAGAMAPQDVAKGEQARNIGLGSFIGISFGLALLLCCVAPWCVIRGCRRMCPCGRRAPGKGDDEVNRAVPAAQIGAQRPELEV